MGVDHGGDWRDASPRILEGDANANCPSPQILSYCKTNLLALQCSKMQCLASFDGDKSSFDQNYVTVL